MSSVSFRLSRLMALSYMKRHEEARICFGCVWNKEWSIGNLSRWCPWRGVSSCSPSGPRRALDGRHRIDDDLRVGLRINAPPSRRPGPRSRGPGMRCRRGASASRPGGRRCRQRGCRSTRAAGRTPRSPLCRPRIEVWHAGWSSGASAIVSLRCQEASGRWEEVWGRIHNQTRAAGPSTPTNLSHTQDRAPPVQRDQPELAGQAPRQSRGDRQAHRRDDDPDRSSGPERARSEPLPGRADGLRRRYGDPPSPARRLPRRVELLAAPPPHAPPGMRRLVSWQSLSCGARSRRPRGGDGAIDRAVEGSQEPSPSSSPGRSRRIAH